MNETERKVIDILTQHEVTPQAWAAPIQAVGRAMNWDTQKTKGVVHGLIDRKLIKWVPIVAHGPIYDPKARWEKGSAYTEP
jgi:hypothetical protein